VAVATPDGFAIALPYGTNTDWLKNVLAHGTATVVTDGSEHTVDDPKVVPIADVEAFFEQKEQRLHRQFAVDTAFIARRSVAEESAESDAGGASEPVHG
jgi:hypothetical protein